MKRLYALVFVALVACSSANDALPSAVSPGAAVPPGATTPTSGVGTQVDTSAALQLDAPVGATVQWSSAAWRKPGPSATTTVAPPSADNDIVVSAGQRLVLNTDATVRNIRVYGTLEFANKDLKLSAASIMVEAGGTFQIGSALNPYTAKAIVTLTGTDANLDLMGMGTKFLGAMGGTISLHGKSNLRAWSKLAQSAAKGANNLQVVDTTGWAVGDSIVMASSSGEPDDAQTNTIADISGSSITLAAPLKTARAARVVTIAGRQLDLRPEIGLLSRNIVVQGDATSSSSGFGGHIMVMAGSKAYIDGVELRNMGQTNRGGRYPFHWHLVGDASGQYIKNSVVNSSLQRGIVIHGTQNATVENNIVFDSLGHNYAIEDSSATNNTLSGNLAIGNRIAVLSDASLKTQNDNQAANYWIRSARNTLTDNVAAGTHSFGFWYDQVTDGPTVFARNVAHSGAVRSKNADFLRGAGLTVENVAATELPDGRERPVTTPLEFSDSLFYQNQTGIWPAEGYQNYGNISLADQTGNDIVAEGVGGLFKLRDTLLVGDSADTANTSGGGGVQMQYGATAQLEHPTFANFGSRSVFGTNDIFVPWQADFTVSTPEFIATAATEQLLPEIGIVELKDSAMQPQGFYVPQAYPQLAGPNAKLVNLGQTDPTPFYQTTKRYGMAGLVVRSGMGGAATAPGTIQRSDGLRYAEASTPAFQLLYDAGFTYQLETAPVGEYVLHLEFFLNIPSGEPAVQVATPANAAPGAVYRAGYSRSDGSAPPAPIAADKLTSASSLAEFQSSPLTTYFYDASAKLLYAQVSARWLVVRP